MFRTTDVFHSIAQFVYEEEPIAVVGSASRLATFEDEEIIGTLMPVYSEIARRLSRNAYTSHGTT